MNSTAVIEPSKSIAKLTAGLTCAPLTFPASKMTSARVPPTTNALPPEANMDKTSKKVPRSSAKYGKTIIFYLWSRYYKRTNLRAFLVLGLFPKRTNLKTSFWVWVLFPKGQMDTINLSGKKRPRQEEMAYCCETCEKCQYMFQEVAILKQDLNDKLIELNKLIESINYRFNDKGNMLSYIS